MIEKNNKDMKEEEIEEIVVPEDRNLKILYITVAVIVGFLLVWMIIVLTRGKNSPDIIAEINSAISQVPTVDDSIVSDDVIIYAEGYEEKVGEE